MLNFQLTLTNIFLPNRFCSLFHVQKWLDVTNDEQYVKLRINYTDMIFWFFCSAGNRSIVDGVERNQIFPLQKKNIRKKLNEISKTVEPTTKYQPDTQVTLTKDFAS